MSRIVKLQERLNGLLDSIETLADKAAEESRDFDEDEQRTFDEAKQQIEEVKAQIEREKEIEELAKNRAKPIPKPDSPIVTGGDPNQPKKKLKAKLLVDMARAMYHGGGQKYAAMMYCEERGLKAAAAVLKAVTNPADTTTATWAAELINEAYADFIELLRPQSVYARSPGLPATLGRNGKLLFPGLTTGVGGGWVGEGQPIPVKQGVFNRQDLLPFKLGVITIQTTELLERSDPSSDAIIRDSMVRDTAIVLDTTFVSNDAAVPGVSPAGLQTYDAAPTASTGTDIPSIDTDISGLVGTVLGLNMDTSLFWLINPIRTNNLRYKSTATGTYPYRDEVDAGMLGGYPMLVSNTVPSDILMLVHSNSLYKLMEGMIELALSTDATLHTNDAPEQIIGGGGTPSIPAEGNVRSVFQEDSVALRLIMPASYGIMRVGAVQVLTGVAW